MQLVSSAGRERNACERLTGWPERHMLVEFKSLMCFSMSLHISGHKVRDPTSSGHDAFLTSGHSQCFTILPNIQPFMHTFTHRRRCQPCKATASSLRAVRVRCVAQGPVDTRAGDRTIKLPVTRRPALPPERHAVVLTCS